MGVECMVLFKGCYLVHNVASNVIQGHLQIWLLIVCLDDICVDSIMLPSESGVQMLHKDRKGKNGVMNF